MPENLTGLAGMPAAIAALGLRPGLTSLRIIHECSHDPDHEVIEDTIVTWDPLRQRQVQVGSLGAFRCNHCYSPVVAEERTLENAVLITRQLERLAKECRRIADLLDEAIPKPWKRHICTQCRIDCIQKGWRIVDPVGEVLQKKPSPDGITTRNGRCITCRTQSQVVEMSNHEYLEMTGRMREDLARREAELAEIVSWLSANDHIFLMPSSEPHCP